MVRLHAAIAATLLVTFVDGTVAGQGGCTFDDETVGITPCGAGHPNKPVAAGRQPGRTSILFRWHGGRALQPDRREFERPGSRRRSQKAVICSD